MIKEAYKKLDEINHRIVIPSRERARWLDGRSFNSTMYLSSLNPYLYVRDDDSQMNEYEQLASKYNNRLIIQDSSKALGASQTYDSLIDQAILDGVEVLFIIDDDLNFKMKNPIQFAKPDYIKVDEHQLRTLLGHAANLVCDELPAMSFLPIMQRTQTHLVDYGASLMWAYVYYIPHFAKHPEHRFWGGSQIEARCDLNLSLRILTEGFLTAKMCTLIIPDNLNNPGGCSTYRSIELERQSVDYLVKHYPDFVATFSKKGWVDDTEVERLAPRIAWKKALNRELFLDRFGIMAEDFAEKHLAIYRKEYSQFIINERIRLAN